MFGYQRKYNSEVEIVRSMDQFLSIIKDKQLAIQIGQCREHLAAGRKKDYDELKRKLPLFIFQAAGVTPSPKNPKDKGCKEMGNYRRQANVILNGLCVLDIDHIDEPAFLWQEICGGHPEVFDVEKGEYWKIVGAYVTPSNQGLKIIFTADPNVGNLADNQKAFSEHLCVINDESIKDSSRGSFAVDYWNWLFINERLISYNNENYDEKYGEQYRRGNSRPVKRAGKSLAGHSNSNDNGCDCSGAAADPEPRVEESGNDVKLINAEDLKYGNTPISELSARYAQRYGSPVEGDRHRSCLKVAGHFRYLVDNNPSKLKVALRTFQWVREWEQSEKNAREIDDIADDVCSQRMWREIPKAVAEIIPSQNSSKHSSRESVSSDAAKSALASDNSEIWSRLQPLLEDDPLYSLCASHIADENKLAAIFVAAGMYDTLATRCTYRHYDGKLHRMNPFVMVIGNPASGKSFADDFDDAIMAIMRASDEPGRQAEAAYKKEFKKRKTSNKAGKGEEQLKEPEECIRYIPSRTSNAIFYRRQKNSKEIVNGEVMPLHLFTFDSELDASVTAQSGGSWIGKHDLELKAFHNEKSGVDYANSDSVNEVITVYWNQVVTGTEVSLAKKINIRNVNDGLCSRLAIIRMSSNDFQMLEVGKNNELEVKYEKMKEWGEFFDSLSGELIIPKLTQHVYNLCKKAAFAAKQKDDHILDYFRKRAVFYAQWFTIPRILARTELERRKNKNVNIMKPTIKQSDLDFAELIFDAVIYYQDVYFGKMLEECWYNGKNAFAVRNITRTTRNEELFDTLPSEFSTSDVATLLCINKNSANQQIMRWKTRNLVTRIGKSQWKKI